MGFHCFFPFFFPFPSIILPKRYILARITEKPLFSTLELEPTAFWEQLVWMDSSNHGGIKELAPTAGGGRSQREELLSSQRLSGVDVGGDRGGAMDVGNDDDDDDAPGVCTSFFSVSKRLPRTHLPALTYGSSMQSGLSFIFVFFFTLSHV
jgi:hypothetical protein